MSQVLCGKPRYRGFSYAGSQNQLQEMLNARLPPAPREKMSHTSQHSRRGTGPPAVRGGRHDREHGNEVLPSDSHSPSRSEGDDAWGRGCARSPARSKSPVLSSPSSSKQVLAFYPVTHWFGKRGISSKSPL